jgi:hypothetical protein
MNSADKKIIDIDRLARYHDNLNDVLITKLQTIIKVTYLELKNLRDSGNLITGQQYRITDYVTTTIQDCTQSAGHPFDIIVTALNENTLSENASAIQHEGDTYFMNSNLSAWKLKYCLDNDTDKFSWVDQTNGKGVIYEMVDEFDNDLPYDFKNIQFKRYSTVGYIEGLVGYDGVGDWSDLNNAESEYLYTFSMKLNDDTIKGEDHA